MFVHVHVSAVRSLRMSGSMFGICKSFKTGLIIETTFSKLVKRQKSSIKSGHFVENMLKYKICGSLFSFAPSSN